MNTTAALEMIEGAARGNARIAVTADLMKEFEPLSRLILDTVDPFITFGVQKLPPSGTPDAPLFETDERFTKELLNLGQRLAQRDLTGHAAANHIGFFRDCCNDVQRKWADRYFLRDLRLDLGSKAIQKIVGKDALKLFDVPLATDYKKMKKIEGRWVSQPKYDGARAVAFINSPEEVVLKSRTGKVWKNFKVIEESILTFAKEAFLPLPFVLDGEVVAVDEDGKIDFQAIQKVLMRKDGVVDTHLNYVVFDGCPLEEWVNPQRTYESRLTMMENIFAELGEEGPMDLELAPYTILELEAATAHEALLKESIMFVNDGYEGGMARKADAVVQNKRTKDLLKVKTFQDAEAEVFGIIEGTGKYAGMLGALQCRLPNGKEFDMGSGFSDAQRADGEQYIGQLVTFKFFETTNDGAPRFPIFKSVRSRDDVKTVDQLEQDEDADE